jgi:predicted SAM-dependent methyltransferase
MTDAEAAGVNEPLRLNIGGDTPRKGWKILNIQPGLNVDYTGDFRDLGQFPDDSVTEIYASHVLEHLGYVDELLDALKESRRILMKGGCLRLSVPDFERLCRMFLHPSLNPEQRFFVMNMIFGGQQDPYDFHKVGLTWEFMQSYLGRAGFSTWRRVEVFGLFENDCSTIRFGGQLISLNIEALK